MPNYNYKVKLHGIRAFAFDVDGVLTDGSIISTSDGDLLRTFDSKDGFALRMCSMKGYPVAIITGGMSQSIVHRFKGLGVKEEDIYQKSRDKVPDFLDFCSRHGLKPEEVAFAVCDYVSLRPGGKAFVRDLIEQVLKVHEDWYLDTEVFAKTF